MEVTEKQSQRSDIRIYFSVTKKGSLRLPYKTCRYRFFTLRVPDAFCIQSLKHPCHIACESTHSLQTFCILFGLARQESVHTVPILRRNNRHIAYCKIFVQAVECRTRTTPTAHCNCSCRFVLQVLLARKEEPVEQSTKRAVRAGVIYRRTDNKTIGIFYLLTYGHIRSVIEYATPKSLATETGNTSLYCNRTDMHYLTLDPQCLKGVRNLCEGAECVSRFTWASIYK